MIIFESDGICLIWSLTLDRCGQKPTNLSNYSLITEDNECNIIDYKYKNQDFERLYF